MEMRIRKLIVTFLLVLCLLTIPGTQVFGSPSADHTKLYPVCSDGLWTYIDRNGNEVWPYQWKYCGQFRGNGFALVCTPDNKYGIISYTGEYVVYPIIEADEGAELGYYGGKDTGVYWLYNGEKYAFFDVQSGFLSPYCFDASQDPWFDGACSNLLRITYDGQQYGYVNRQSGQLQIPCIFSQINTIGFHHGFAVETLEKTNKTVVVREDGTFLSLNDKLQPVEGELFEDGLLLVQDMTSGLYGYCDMDGNCPIYPLYDNATSFCNGYASVCVKGKWGHIDSNGNPCSSFVFDTPYQFVSSKAVAQYNGMPVLIKTDGSIDKYLPASYQYFDFLSQGVVLFTDGQYDGLIDSQGEVILPLSSMIFIDVYQANAPLFSNGLQPAMNRDGKWGYLDLSGAAVIPFVWDTAFPFVDGLACVTLKGKMSLIDISGATLWSEPD